MMTIYGVEMPFTYESGSPHGWPHNCGTAHCDPICSPYERYTCEWCGWIASIEEYGEFMIGEQRENKNDILVFHADRCPKRPQTERESTTGKLQNLAFSRGYERAREDAVNACERMDTALGCSQQIRHMVMSEEIR